MFEKRLKILGRLCFFLLFLLSVRLFHLGVYSSKTLETMAQKQQERSLDIESIRGDITDRHGENLTGAENKKLYLTAGAEITEKAQTGAMWEFEIPKRFSSLAPHVIGYTDADGEGKSGLELFYNSILKTDGAFRLQYAADALGSPVGGYRLSYKKPKEKTDIKLTIDKKIQQAVQDIMGKHIRKGAAVVIDVKSFDVLAMVSVPAYDPEKLKDYEASSDGELLNRALLGYNAGSVFKIVTAASALEKNSSYIQRYFDCRGSYALDDGHLFGCNKKEGHGILYFSDAFAKSCNCSFYVTALETGAEDIVNTAKKFGIGNPLLNVDLGEAKGNLPVRSIYSPAETLNISIGQGEILITPMQCAAMAATIANKGVRRDVNLIKGLVCGKKNKSIKTKGTNEVISPDTAQTIADMMRECVLSGTALGASGSKINIAGKTGSAESGWVENGSALVHGWFCGFFPYEEPRYAMAILSEGGGSGAGSCVTPFVEIAEKINEIYPVKQ